MTIQGTPNIRITLFEEDGKDNDDEFVLLASLLESMFKALIECCVC